MQITRLRTENFRILAGVHDWEFPTGIIGLAGSNGVGKSTVANAIAWAMFGPEVLPTGKADVVTWGENLAQVEVEFQMPSGAYVVTRWQRLSGASGAALLHDGETIATGLDPTTVEVGRVLGVDRTGFLVSVFSRQEELAGLSSLTPANRVKTVLKLLGVDIVSAAIDRVRDDSRLTKRELEVLRRGSLDVEEAETRLTELDRESVNNLGLLRELGLEREKTERNLAELGLELTSQRAALRDFEMWRHQDQTLVGRINGAAKGIRDALDVVDKLNPPPSPGEPPGRVDHERIVDLLSGIKTAEARSAELNKARKDRVCPACGRAFEHAESHIREIEAELGRLRGRQQADEAALAELRIAEAKAEAWQRQADEVERFLATRQQIRQAIWAAQDVYHDASVERNLLITLTAPDISATEAVVNELREKLTQVREEAAHQAAKQKAAEGEKSRLKTALAAAGVAAAELKRVETEVTVLDVTVAELGDLKSELVEEAIPSLESIGSQIVAELTDGVYDELRLTPTYEIQYRSSLGELKPFAHLSGGEQDVFALALRLAIAELQSEGIGVLFLDEVLESLDEDRQEMAWRAFEKLTKRYQQLFVVTHVEKFRDRAPTTISL